MINSSPWSSWACIARPLCQLLSALENQPWPMLMSQALAAPIAPVPLLLFALLTFPSSSLGVAAAGTELQHISGHCLLKMASLSWREKVDMLVHKHKKWEPFRTWLRVLIKILWKNVCVRLQGWNIVFPLYPVMFLSGCALSLKLLRHRCHSFPEWCLERYWLPWHHCRSYFPLVVTMDSNYLFYFFFYFQISSMVGS